MTAFLPPNLLALFAARDPIAYMPSNEKPSHEKRRVSYGGVASCLSEFEDPKDTPPPTRVETKDERKERKRKERAEQIAYKLEQDLALWDPNANSHGTSDPYKTLFVARINFDTSESKLRREFEVYGPIRKIYLITDKISAKPRGYAFIEYEHERDMHSAYKHADGKKIDGRRVLVDVERGRTVKGWQPRRLGGGLGGTRKGGPDENTRFSGRDEYSGSYRDREREGSRERGGEGGRRRRSRSRERRRSRSKERRRSRSRERERRKDDDEERKERREKRSRRSRSRDRKRSRSRDRDRKRSRRSRSRDRDRRRSQDREEQGPEEGAGDLRPEEIHIKQEVIREGYGDEPTNGYSGDFPTTNYNSGNFQRENYQGGEDDGYSQDEQQDYQE